MWRTKGRFGLRTKSCRTSDCQRGFECALGGRATNVMFAVKRSSAERWRDNCELHWWRCGRVNAAAADWQWWTVDVRPAALTSGVDWPLHLSRPMMMSSYYMRGAHHRHVVSPILPRASQSIHTGIVPMCRNVGQYVRLKRTDVRGSWRLLHYVNLLTYLLAYLLTDGEWLSNF